MNNPPAEIVKMIQPLIPDWRLLGYGPEIIEFQSPKKDGYKVLILRSVHWPKGHAAGQAAKCDWYIYTNHHPPDQKIQDQINLILNGK